MHSKRLAVATGSVALIAGALVAAYETVEGIPRPTGKHCVVISALCPADGGRQYAVATVMADPLDAGVGDGAAERMLSIVRDFERRIKDVTGCEVVDLWQDRDGGMCAYQASAVQLITRRPPHRCRCCRLPRAPDGGCSSWTRLPCTVRAGYLDRAVDHGCASGENAERAP